jgi:putative NIF3 family GTP cyclohydrolase 1 type 2
MKLIFITILLFPVIVLAQNNKPYTAEDIVNLIKKQVTCEWADKTVDTFKTGDPKPEVTGIVSCMFADMKTLKKAADLNCNLIITHEPVFYNHLDETSMFKNDPVYIEKQKFINDNNLVVFRFHDHIHRTKPDGIYEGMINKLGWKKYSVNGSLRKFKIPETNIAQFTKNIKETLKLETVRIIGNTDMNFTSVVFAAGAPGGQSHIRTLRDKNVEVLVAGEAPEWETYLYANDAVSLGKNKAVIFLGHIKSEEAGMEYCAQWLKGFVSGVPILFIENKANFIEL